MKLYVVMALAMPVLAGACKGKGSTGDKTAPPPQLPVVQLEQKDTSLQESYVASIEAIKNVEIRARVAGFLEKIFVDEGQPVKKGQPLFQISSQEYAAELARCKAALNSAEAEARAAKLEMDRVKILVDKKIITASEYDLSQARVKAAQAKIEEAASLKSNAETKLSYTYIRAPFDGMIDRIPLKTGSLVTEGALLTALSDLQSVYAYFSVSENEYLQYIQLPANKQQESRTVQLTLADGSHYPHEGRIETIEGEIEEGTGSIAFRAKFANPNRVLRHGGTGKVLLNTAMENALLVPQKAVFEIQDKSFVYVVGKDNRVKQRSFVPKTRIADCYIVQSGLLPGDKVVFEGIQSLQEGVAIDPQLVSADSLSLDKG
ncbi:efflux RND transporter periplasmic adaptor subunit [Deminuibacter soli]|nr:efflux RND transporter periplasmic adaptor subunit [Deminuibacter soli]